MVVVVAIAVCGTTRAATPAEEVASLCSGDADMSVEVLVFSGTLNPSFLLQGEERSRFCSLLKAATVNGTTRLRLPNCRALGFQGWRVCRTTAATVGASSSSKRCSRLLAGPHNAEAVLEQAFQRMQVSVGHSVLQHIREETERLQHNGGDDSKCSHTSSPVPDDSPATCDSTPILGPDDPQQVHFDVNQDDKGCFVEKESYNNCYDYANDIVTNTFAQPGRASGLCPPSARPCVKNTCEDVRRGAESDGLKWVGTSLPNSLPPTGHYVSLHIWPSSNFHWLRMDANMLWSHKPGGTPVRNVDNNRETIRDPSKADLSPWTEHCGYMLAVPSGVNIKMTSSQVMLV